MGHGHAVNFSREKTMNAEEEAYYAPCVRDYRSVNNRNAQDEWFVATQPDADELPTHQRVLSLEVAKGVAGAFLTQLSISVMENAIYRWWRGTPLPAKNGKIQPLADGPYQNPIP